MSLDIGWRYLASRIMKVGFSARLAPEFDLWAQARVIDEQVEKTRRVPWWPLAAGAPALAIPYGYYLSIGAAAYWAVLKLRARQKAEEQRAALEKDLAKRERDVKIEGDRLLVRADAADDAAIATLFDRWMKLRPTVLKSLQLRVTSLMDESGESDWLIEGNAVSRAELAEHLPESGPTQRGFAGERNPSAIDKELAEVNTAAVLSVVWALFAGPSSHRINVHLTIAPPGSGEEILWVWLRATVNESRLLSAIANQSSAVDALRVLGGDVGRCFAGTYSSARADANPSGFYSIGRFAIAKRLPPPMSAVQHIDAPYSHFLTSGSVPSKRLTPTSSEVVVPGVEASAAVAEGVDAELVDARIDAARAVAEGVEVGGAVEVGGGADVERGAGVADAVELESGAGVANVQRVADAAVAEGVLSVASPNELRPPNELTPPDELASTSEVVSQLVSTTETVSTLVSATEMASAADMISPLAKTSAPIGAEEKRAPAEVPTAAASALESMDTEALLVTDVGAVEASTAESHAAPGLTRDSELLVEPVASDAATIVELSADADSLPDFESPAVEQVTISASRVERAVVDEDVRSDETADVVDLVKPSNELANTAEISTSTADLGQEPSIEFAADFDVHPVTEVDAPVAANLDVSAATELETPVVAGLDVRDAVGSDARDEAGLDAHDAVGLEAHVVPGLDARDADEHNAVAAAEEEELLARPESVTREEISEHEPVPVSAHEGVVELATAVEPEAVAETDALTAAQPRTADEAVAADGTFSADETFPADEAAAEEAALAAGGARDVAADSLGTTRPSLTQAEAKPAIPDFVYAEYAHEEDESPDDSATNTRDIAAHDTLQDAAASAEIDTAQFGALDAFISIERAIAEHAAPTPNDASREPELAPAPPAPASLADAYSTTTPPYATVVPRIDGELFVPTAQEYVDFEGTTSAPWVAFRQAPASYTSMDAGQLAFYFRWRNAIRNNAAIRSDIGYVYTHAFELLHVIGAPNAADAARQLERLWLAYRASFPELDDELVSWTADLLATEVSQEAAIAFLERALFAGAHLREDEAMLVVDRYWARGEYSALPNAGIALLVGDPHFFDEKFYQTYNTAPRGAGWIDRCFREALAITDHVVASTTGRSPRDIAIARHGLTEVGRAAFAGAIYDYGRKSAVLGTITSLPHAAPVAATYRKALLFVEDLLRQSAGFPVEERGIPPRLELAHALRERFESYPAPSTDAAAPAPPVPVVESPVQRNVDALAADAPRTEREPRDTPPFIAAGDPVTPTLPPPPPPAATKNVEQDESANDMSEAAKRMVAFFEQPPLTGTTPLPSFQPLVTPIPDDFGPVELEVLRVISREPANVRRFENPKTLLRELASRHATTPWLLIHRVNQVARRTPFGNRVIDINADPPRIHEQARTFVEELIARVKK